eukprot:11214082-Lingulodinium_polyedra.AAC.1
MEDDRIGRRHLELKEAVREEVVLLQSIPWPVWERFVQLEAPGTAAPLIRHECLASGLISA